MVLKFAPDEHLNPSETRTSTKSYNRKDTNIYRTIFNLQEVGFPPESLLANYEYVGFFIISELNFIGRYHIHTCKKERLTSRANLFATFEPSSDFQN